MVAFAQSVHERPFARLLDELPQLARLSETKFNLATRVLRRRFEVESELMQAQLREYGERVACTTTPWVASRIRAIFDFPQG